MNLRILNQDPFNVLSSTKPFVENAHFVKINGKNLEEISKYILERLNQGLGGPEEHLGATGNFAKDVQLVFLEDIVNFCFWAEKEKPKWSIEWPKGKITNGGWYSLTKCFQRAIAEKIPVLDADYLINLNIEQVESIFRGFNKTKIPLIEKRLENLIEAGQILKKEYDGKFINALESAKFDAIKIVNLILSDFPCFRDIVAIDNKKVYFLKRAQICALDFSNLKKKKIKNIETLTAFADYKIPQMLRKFGIISYSKELEDKIDNYVLIKEGCREEVEIRSATIWSIELIRQKLKKYTAADIDSSLWLISQNQTNIKPYHRTYTIYY
ncbi:MAG: queuosine salvage family protein [Patescibacteria group bacterium]|nr:queuosine salvage family protein [Patescibacteria group bacterium]